MTADNVTKLPSGIDIIRYGNEHGEFDNDAPSRIAKFVLGHDINTRISVLNEGLTEVVQPISDFWNPEKGVADILVTDPKTGIQMTVGLGQWLARYPGGRLRPITDHVYNGLKSIPKVPQTFEQDLVDLIIEHKMDDATKTPAPILAGFIGGCLRSFNSANRKRGESK